MNNAKELIAAWYLFLGVINFTCRNFGREVLDIGITHEWRSLQRS
jgi:hypothetical protein